MDILPILSTLRRHKITAWLLILEIALTCAIVCNAVFLISQRLERMRIPSGVAEHELVQIQLANIGNRPDAAARAETDLAALRQIPGVQQAALTNQLPLSSGGSWNSGVKLEPQQQLDTANVVQYMGQNLLPTLGTRLIAGREFRPDEFVDYADAVAALQSGNMKGLPQTLVITQALAERLWPGRSALGRPLYFGQGIPFRVIGVIANLARPNMLEKGAEYSTVWPIRLNLTQGASYLIRCAPQDREQILKAALAKLKQLDPRRVVLEKRTWDEARYEFFQSDRAMASILVGVCVALLIVTALGATRSNILHYFQTENFLLATVGIGLGMVLSFGINLFLMTHYELPRLPAIYFPVGALLLWLIGQLAVLGPALRAAAVPPVVATRSV